jgi:glycosyltransferase involved in cell wall biosynthesis
MDHHEGFGNVSEDLIKLEKEMMCRFDQIIVSSAWLEKQVQQYNNNVVVIRNASEYEHFNHPPIEIYSDPKGRKIIGYYGAIAEWFDLELVQRLALAEPDALILLIGNDTINASRILKEMPNIIFTGEVSYDRLPFYLYAFDVCLLPFKISPLTLATNPVKIYEYLASGKPVVSVDLPEIAQFENLVQRANLYHWFLLV